MPPLLTDVAVNKLIAMVSINQSEASNFIIDQSEASNLIIDQSEASNLIIDQSEVSILIVVPGQHERQLQQLDVQHHQPGELHTSCLHMRSKIDQSELNTICVNQSEHSNWLSLTILD